MGDSVQPFAPKVPLSDTPPVPILATWEDDFTGVEITFDKDLNDVPITRLNWVLVVAGRRRRLLDPNVFGGNKIGSQTSPTGLPQLGSFITYKATPPDVVGQNTFPVEEFFNFPVNQL